MDLKNPFARVMIVIVTTFAIIAAAAQAASAVPSTTKATPSYTPAQVAAIEQYAVDVSNAAQTSLENTGVADFKDYDGKSHAVRLAGNTISLDGKVLASKSPTPMVAQTTQVASGWWCTTKVAAAVIAIVAVGAAVIGWAVAPLGAAESLTIARITLKVSQWKRVQVLIGAGGALAAFLRTILC